MDVSGNPVVVTDPSETNYDMVYYETVFTGSDGDPSAHIQMDQVILGITNDATGQTYYQVFNWGDSQPDTNSNVDSSDATLPVAIDPAETDNEHIATADLHQDPSAPSSPQTGIAIDVDNAPSAPPPGSYNYVVVIAPATQPPPAGPSTDGGQTDSVQVTEVPNP